MGSLEGDVQLVEVGLGCVQVNLLLAAERRAVKASYALQAGQAVRVFVAVAEQIHYFFEGEVLYEVIGFGHFIGKPTRLEAGLFQANLTSQGQLRTKSLEKERTGLGEEGKPRQGYKRTD